MPSIRQTLQEMGVSAEQVLTELTRRSPHDMNNGNVPTPLTNYLDVRHFFVLSIVILYTHKHFYLLVCLKQRWF